MGDQIVSMIRKVAAIAAVAVICGYGGWIYMEIEPMPATQLQQSNLTAEEKAYDEALRAHLNRARGEKEMREFEGRRMVAAALKDPSSANFGETFASAIPGSGLCGSVNARNGFGGMTGMQRFIAVPSKGEVLVDEGSNSERNSFSARWREVCGSR